METTITSNKNSKITKVNGQFRVYLFGSLYGTYERLDTALSQADGWDNVLPN